MFYPSRTRSHLADHNARVAYYYHEATRGNDLVTTLALLFHDVGKLYGDDKFFNEHYAFLPEDRALRNLHSAYSGQVAAFIGFNGTLLRVPKEHHERFDGSGYNEGLVRYANSPEALAGGVCDCFDAMTDDKRVYRGSIITHKDAIADLERKATQHFGDKPDYHPRFVLASLSQMVRSGSIQIPTDEVIDQFVPAICSQSVRAVASANQGFAL
jgi:HD-GYP domain-containing protein (c-di-GMP phosphodiesterase class II)